MATFGVIISNRSFFPDHLVLTAREKLLRSLDAWGHKYIILSQSQSIPYTLKVGLYLSFF